MRSKKMFAALSLFFVSTAAFAAQEEDWGLSFEDSVRLSASRMNYRPKRGGNDVMDSSLAAPERIFLTQELLSAGVESSLVKEHAEQGAELLAQIKKLSGIWHTLSVQIDELMKNADDLRERFFSFVKLNQRCRRAVVKPFLKQCCVVLAHNKTSEAWETSLSCHEPSYSLKGKRACAAGYIRTHCAQKGVSWPVEIEDLLASHIYLFMPIVSFDVGEAYGGTPVSYNFQAFIQSWRENICASYFHVELSAAPSSNVFFFNIPADMPIEDTIRLRGVLTLPWSLKTFDEKKGDLPWSTAVLNAFFRALGARSEQEKKELLSRCTQELEQANQFVIVPAGDSPKQIIDGIVSNLGSPSLEPMNGNKMKNGDASQFFCLMHRHLSKLKKESAQEATGVASCFYKTTIISAEAT